MADSVIRRKQNSDVANKPTSMIRMRRTNSYGSTATHIKRFLTLVESKGSDIVFSDSASLGSSFTIQRDGVYSIAYDDASTTAGISLGISKNSSVLNTPIQNLVDDEMLLYWNPRNANEAQAGTWVGFLNAGDVIRAQTDGEPDGVNPERYTFTITQLVRL